MREIGSEFSMDKDELIDAINAGPIEIVMNDDSRHAIPSAEFASVSDLTVHVLVRYGERL